jgi:hypothetical protein
MLHCSIPTLIIGAEARMSRRKLRLLFLPSEEVWPAEAGN